MAYPRSRRQRLAVIALGMALLLAGALLWLDPAGWRLAPGSARALARQQRACFQFIQHSHPGSVLWQRLSHWWRGLRASVSIEAEHHTPHGLLILYRVDCPVGATGEWLSLHGYRLVTNAPGADASIIAEDIGPARPPWGSSMLQPLSGSRAPRANGQLLTTSFGRIIDPAVDTVEATLETGAVVQARTSEQSFLVLVEGSHAVCELRALAASGRLLERIPGQEPLCPGQ